MKKTLTALALFAALATGATTANASMPAHAAHNEKLQTYYYYFGAPCCDRLATATPCGMEAPCAVAPAPCGECPSAMVPVEYEQVCSSCCGGFNVLNPFTYFG